MVESAVLQTMVVPGFPSLARQHSGSLQTAWLPGEYMVSRWMSVRCNTRSVGDPGCSNKHSTSAHTESATLVKKKKNFKIHTLSTNTQTMTECESHVLQQQTLSMVTVFITTQHHTILSKLAPFQNTHTHTHTHTHTPTHLYMLQLLTGNKLQVITYSTACSKTFL